MFGGIIAHLGELVGCERDPRGGARLRVRAPEALAEGVEPKDSIAIDGACLTVVERDGESMAFDVVPETLARTALGERTVGDRVNVELSLRLGDRLGGHLVYGHVDAAPPILERQTEGQGMRVWVETPRGLERFIVEKGYVALDGVSLTVAAVEPGRFAIALIPETSRRTTLGRRDKGARLNLEVDPFARYALGAAADYAKHVPSADEIAWAYEI